jgi:NNP family nitrate/nitrite transporter-like MFS transporter
MEAGSKASRINLFDFATPQMRAFHMSWLAFFVCMFGWFGIAPLMPAVREDLGLTRTQIGNTIIASVAITIFARLIVGRLCDRYGARLTYTTLLLVGSLPVMCIGLADRYETFLLCRLVIGGIGASFVITQYHTSMMFGPNCIGTANATTAGWGNLGGGLTQMTMPLVLALLVWLGVGEHLGWRLAMVVPGIAMIVMGVAYYFFTKDTPEGNLAEVQTRDDSPPLEKGSLWAVARDTRVWALFVVYGACFGVELTINNIAALYYFDTFDLSMGTAGLLAGLFGLNNLFARSLGGYVSDRLSRSGGLSARIWFLGGVLFLEGIALIIFSQMNALWLAVTSMIVFSIFVQMANGATFGIVPFINRRALGSVAGIVGAGGNAGAVAAGFLFRSEAFSIQQGLLILGLVVTATSLVTLFVHRSADTERSLPLGNAEVLAP